MAVQQKTTGHRREPAEQRPVSNSPSAPQQLAREREYLFISYAWEDRAFADWLYARLTAEGFRVWMDRKRLYGGERWTKEIDVAIKDRSFRMLAVLSRYSLAKPNPSKERTLALSLGRERNEDFLIPLNVGGVSDSQLDWLTSDITYIPFGNWAAGFAQLMTRLGTLNAPRPLVQEGRSLAIRWFDPENVILEGRDQLYTNCFRFAQLPSTIRVARKTVAPAPGQQLEIADPVLYQVGDTHVAAFEFDEAMGEDAAMDVIDLNWRETETIHGIASVNIVSSLLRQTLEREWIRRGLTQDPVSRLTYFPAGLTPNDKISYTTLAGRSIKVNAVGVRKLRGEKTRYHLAPVFRVRQDMGAEFTAQLRIRVYLTDVQGNRLDASRAFSRRKALTSNWFNHQWLTRYLAVAEFFSQAMPVVNMGAASGVRLQAMPLSGFVPMRINDQALEPIRKELTPRYEEDYEIDQHEEG
jgi:hypothetical protein